MTNSDESFFKVKQATPTKVRLADDVEPPNAQPPTTKPSKPGRDTTNVTTTPTSSDHLYTYSFNFCSFENPF